MNNDMISIIDYGVGNVASVLNMVKHVGGEANIISSPQDLESATKLIFPGIGSFDYAVQCLQNNNWINALNSTVLERKIPILGICLGMQLMCKYSEEGILTGLGWIDAQVKRFTAGQEKLKIPHMGWNHVEVVSDNPLVINEEPNQRFYFVHSYYVECNTENDVILKSRYGINFVAGFQHKNIFGVQFHPEKSHRYGKQLIKQFLEV